MKPGRSIILVIAALFVASEARAQWDAPSFMPPVPGDDIGIYISTIRNFGIQGIWRQSGNLNLGVRVGYIDGDRDAGVVMGIETWNAIFAADTTFPVDVSWTLGAGAAIDGGTTVSVPFGVSIGRTFRLDPLSIQAYGQPRIALVVRPGSANEVDIDGLFDLGADIDLGGGFLVRTGATLGAFNAVGVGVAFPVGRVVAVR